MPNPKISPERIAELERDLPQPLRDMLAKKGETLSNMSGETSWLIARSIFASYVLDDRVPRELRLDLMKKLLSLTKLHAYVSLPYMIQGALNAVDGDDPLEAVVALTEFGARSFSRELPHAQNLATAAHEAVTASRAKTKKDSAQEVLITPPPSTTTEN